MVFALGVVEDADEVERVHAQRGRRDIDGRLEALFAKGKQPLDAIPITGDLGVVQMVIAQSG